MSAKPFSSIGGNLTGLCRDVQPVTPNDSSDILTSGDAVFIQCKGTAGNVVMTTADGTDRTFPISADEIVPVGVTRVKATGTTATTLWAYIP